jgi:hypothetical protein
VHLGSQDSHPHGNQTLPGLAVACNGLQCMRYPITKFLVGRGQRWHIKSVFNELPKTEIAWCNIRRTGWPREKVVSICSKSDPELRKDTIEKHSYIPVKMGGGGSSIQLQNVISKIGIQLRLHPVFQHVQKWVSSRSYFSEEKWAVHFLAGDSTENADSWRATLVPPGHIILVWCVSFKPCTKLTLHCNHMSGLKTKHTEDLLMLRRHLGNRSRGPAVSMISELLVVREKRGQFALLTEYVVPL